MRIHTVICILGFAVAAGCASSSSLTRADFRQVRERQRIVADQIGSATRDLDVAVGIMWKGRYSESGELKDLSEAVDRLPEGARNVFVLHGIYGYTHDETGEMLGIATGTSKAQLHRARRLLAQQLKTPT